MPLLWATSFSRPVATIGGSVISSGTAWRCMLEPMRARLASSCSRKGISPADTPTICLGRDIDVLNLVGADVAEIAAEAGDHAIVRQLVTVRGRIRQEPGCASDSSSAQPGYFLRELALVHLAIGRDQEAVFVHSGVNAQTGDQADVGAFRRFDRADAAIVRDMYVAHLETGALAVEAARSQGAQAPLVRQLRERVRLIDDLAQLAAAEEILNSRRNALGVDQRARRHVLLVADAHAFLDGAPELEEALAQLVGRQLIDGAQAAVAEVVDVVDVAFAGPQLARCSGSR